MTSSASRWTSWLPSIFQSSKVSLRSKVKQYKSELNDSKSNTQTKNEIEKEIQRLEREIPEFIETSTQEILNAYRRVNDQNLKTHLYHLYRALLQLNSCEVIVAKWLLEGPPSEYSNYVPRLLKQLKKAFEQMKTQGPDAKKEATMYIDIIDQTAEYVEDVRAFHYYYYELEKKGDWTKGPSKCPFKNRKIILSDEMNQSQSHKFSPKQIEDISKKFEETQKYGSLIKQVQKTRDEPINLTEFLDNLDSELTINDFEAEEDAESLSDFMTVYPQLPRDVYSKIKIDQSKSKTKAIIPQTITSGVTKDYQQQKSKKLWTILGWFSCLLFAVLLFMSTYFRTEQTLSVAFGVGALFFLCLTLLAIYYSRKINLMFVLFLSFVVVAPIAYYMNTD